MKFSNNHLKKIILLIWALWFSIVSLTNICDALRSLGVIPEWFRFVSGNFQYISAVTAIYLFPYWLNAILFLVVIILEVSTSFLFFKAFLNVTVNNENFIVPPFIFSLIIFGGFMVMDEIFVAYDRMGNIETTHLGILVGLLASYIAVID